MKHEKKESKAFERKEEHGLKGKGGKSMKAGGKGFVAGFTLKDSKKV